MGLFACFAPPREAGWGAPGFGDAVSGLAPPFRSCRSRPAASPPPLLLSAQYLPRPPRLQAASSARARLLEVVEEEVEERFCALGPLPPGASAARASHDAAFMRRLYQANLPAAEMGRAKDLLRKLAAIDAARAAAEAVSGAAGGGPSRACMRRAAPLLAGLAGS